MTSIRCQVTLPVCHGHWRSDARSAAGFREQGGALFFLYARGEGYPRDIARFFATGLAPIQKQLEVLERGGILVSRLAGRTRLYTFNPAYPLLQEVKALVEKAVAFYPEEERDRLLLDRKRPRRRNKPL